MRSFTTSGILAHVSEITLRTWPIVFLFLLGFSFIPLKNAHAQSCSTGSVESPFTAPASSPVCDTWKTVPATNGVGANSRRAYTNFLAGYTYEIDWDANGSGGTCAEFRFRNSGGTVTSPYYTITSGSQTVTAPTNTDRVELRVAGTWNNVSALLKYRIARPSPNAGADVQTCDGSATLSGSTDFGTTAWSAGAPNVTGIGVNSSAVYTYSANNNGCVGSSSVTVYNRTPEGVAASGGGTICSGGSITLTASGGTGGTIYFQGTDNDGMETGLGGSSVSVSAAGTYYFRSYNATYDCWGAISNSVVVNVVSDPTLSAPSNHADICQGEDATFTSNNSGGTGTLTYIWECSPNGSSGWQNVNVETTTDATYQDQTTSTLQVNNISTVGTHYYRRRQTNNTLGCAVTSAVRSVTVDPAPTVFAGSDLTFCTGTADVPMDGTGSLNASTPPTRTNGTHEWTIPPFGTTGWTQGTNPDDAIVSTGGNTNLTVTALLTVTGLGACSSEVVTDDREVTVYAPPVISSVIATGVTNCNSPNGKIEIEATGNGSLTYSINGGGSFNTSSTFTNLTDGNYSVVVKDANGCETAYGSVTVNPLSAPVLTSATVTTNVLCGGESTGVISLAGIGGGAPDYEYTLFGTGSTRWTDIGSSSSATAQNVSAGSYNVLFRDRYGCQSNVIPLTVTENAPIEVTNVTSVGAGACGSGGGGSIDVDAIGGSGTLSYDLNPGGTSATGNWSGLDAGAYEVVITDPLGCSQVVTTNVSAAWVPDPGNDVYKCGTGNVVLPGSIIGEFPVACQPVCTSGCGMPSGYCAAASGDGRDDWIDLVTVEHENGSMSNGTNAFNFNGSNGTTYQDFSSSSAMLMYRGNDYDMSVRVQRDGSQWSSPSSSWNQCVRVYIDWNRDGVFNDGSIDLGCRTGTTVNNASDGPLTSIHGGTNIISVPANASLGTTRMRVIELFGSYANQCNSIGGSYGEVEDYQIVIEEPYDPCVPTVSWSGTGIVSGGSTYTPTVNPSSTTTYTMSINDDNGCTQTADVTVYVSTGLSVSNSVNNVDCFGGNDACVTITPTNGIAPYLLIPQTGAAQVWGGNMQPLTITSNVALTNHQVSVDINWIAPMRADFGDIRFYTAAGVAIPYWVETYTPSGVATVWLKVPAIANGSTTVYMTYGNNALTTQSDGDAVFEFFDNFNSFDATKWTAGTIGSTSGTDWSHFDGIMSGGNTNRTLTSSTAFTGNYVAETRIYVSSNPTNGFTSLGFHGSTANGLEILSHGGDNNYLRSNGGWGTPTAYNIRNVWTRDFIQASGASSYMSRTRETGGAVTIARTNNGLAGEPIRLGARGDDAVYNGTGWDFSAQWDWLFVRKYTTASISVSLGSAMAPDNEFCGLSAGNFSVDVVDMGNCTETESVTVTQPTTALNVSLVSNPDICPGGTNGSIDITASGGTVGSGYGFGWAGPSFSAGTEDISGLSVGTYSVVVSDQNGCIANASYDVEENLTPFSPGAILTTGETICYGGDPSTIGQATAPSGGDLTYTYQWYAGGVLIPGATGTTYNPPSGLTATTTYTREVMDGFCSTSLVASTGSWTVIVRPQLNGGTIGSNQTICYNTAPSQLGFTSVPTGGTGSYTYQWYEDGSLISGATSSTYTPGALTSDTDYYVEVTSAPCGTVQSNNTITITVGANNSVGAASSSPVVCVGATNINVTHTIPLDATGITNVTGLPGSVNAAWSSGVITITGTPSTTGTFNYSVEVVGGCLDGALATGTITVTPNNTASAASSTPTQCINAALTAFTHTTTGATGISNDGVTGANGLPAGVSATWAGNTITISGIPTASGTFNYSIPLTGGCGSVNATGTITVTPNYTAGAASSTPTLCINTALITPITHTTTGATGIGVPTGLPAGVSSSFVSNEIIISGTPTESGTFNYSIPLSGGCGSVNATGTITVTPNNTAGAASSTPTLCINTALTNITHTTTGATGIADNGIAGANGLPAGVSASWAGNIITISGTPTASGPFNYSIPLTGGCGSINATGTITVSPAEPVSVSIALASGSASTICTGTSVTFEATPTNGGSSPSYQWQVDGSNVGTNSDTYSTTSLLDGEEVTVILTSNATCATLNPATSSGITMTVIDPATPVASITSQPTCATAGGVIEIDSPLGAAYEYSLDGVNYQSSTTFTGLTPGTYQATARLAASPSCVSGTGSSLTINSVPTQLTAPDVFVCQGGSVSITAPTNCIDNFVAPANANRIFSGWASSGPTAAVPAGANTSTCSFSAPNRLYSEVVFQVSITGNYIFEMDDNAGYDAAAYIYTGSFSPGSCATGTFVRADNNSGSGNEPQLGGAGGSGSMTLTAGVTYTLVSITSGGPSTYSWTITPPSGGDLLLSAPGTVVWYDAASGGSVFATGETITLPYNGYPDNSVLGITNIYAACSSSPDCRTEIAFEVTNSTDIYTVTPNAASCYDASSPVSVGISGSTIGITYRLLRDGVWTGDAAAGTGSALTLGNTTVDGLYTVVAYISAGCEIPMNGSTEIKPIPTADAGSDVSLCGSSVSLSGASNSTDIFTENFGTDNNELSPTPFSDWAIDYLFDNHPANRTEWWISYDGATPFDFDCATSGSALVMVDNLSQYGQGYQACDYAWDDGVMDEIAYNTTPIDARLYTSVTLTFDYMVGGNYNAGRTPQATDYMQVVYSLDNGATWIAIDQGNNSGSLYRQLNGTTNAFFSTTGTSVTGSANITMPAAVEGEYFLLGFRWVNDGDQAGDYVGNMMVDNIVVTGDTDYSWSPSAASGGTTPAPTVDQPGTYTLTVTAGNGCTAESTVEVLPKPDISDLSETVCSGSTFSVTPVDVTDGTVPSGTTYSWSAPSVSGITGTAAGSGASSIGGTLTNTTSSAIAVTYTVTPFGNSCTGDNFDVVVTVNPTPSSGSLAETICSGASFSVAPVNGTDGIIPSGTTYSWGVPSVTGGITGGAAGTDEGNVFGTLTNPSTTSSHTATYTVVPESADGCVGSSFEVVVTVEGTVTQPTAITFSSEPSCQLTTAGTSTDYNSTTALGTLFWTLTGITNTTGTLLGAAIDNTTGEVSWPNGWSGSATINVVSNGCNGPSAATTHTITVTPTVGTPDPITVSVGPEPACQLTNGTTTTTYTSSATDNTGLTWSVSPVGAGSIDAGGVMTWTNGYSGNATISVEANGCNGPSASVDRVVTVTPTVGIPTAISIDSGTNPSCEISGSPTTDYGTTATNSTGFNWSYVSTPAGAGTIDASTGEMTWNNGYSGSVEIRVTADGCNGPSAQVTTTITINALPDAPVVGNITQPTCDVATATVDLSSLPAGSWTLAQSPGGNSTGSGTTTSVTGLAANTTYSWTVTNAAGCTSASSGNAVIIPQPTSIPNGFDITWTGLGGDQLWQNPQNWDCAVPDSDDNVLIPANPLGGADKTPIIMNLITGYCNTITIEDNATYPTRLEIQTGGTLDVTP